MIRRFRRCDNPNCQLFDYHGEVKSERKSPFYLIIAAPMVAVVVVGWLAAYRGRLISCYMIRNLQEQVWHLDVVPVALGKLSNDKVNRTRYSHYGCEFELPWTGPATEREVAFHSFTSTASGHAAIFCDPSKSRLRFLRGPNPETVRNLTMVLGKVPMESDYSMLKSALTATPQDFSFGLSGLDAIKLMTLLKIKALELIPAEDSTRISSFETASVRGFEFGQPGVARRIEILAFEGADNPIELSILAPKDGASSLTQSDINVILTSITCGRQTPK